MDTLTVAERSERMGRVRSKDTKPEVVVRRLVHSLCLGCAPYPTRCDVGVGLSRRYRHALNIASRNALQQGECGPKSHGT
jgi:hypothetical protein